MAAKFKNLDKVPAILHHLLSKTKNGLIKDEKLIAPRHSR